MLSPNQLIANLKPYRLVNSLGQINVRKGKPLKLDWNESPLPPSPQVIRALGRVLNNSNQFSWYADTTNEETYELIKQFFDVSNTRMILLTNGSDAALELILRCYIEKGDLVSIPQPTYSQFTVLAKSVSDRVNTWVMNDPFHPSIDEIINHSRDAKLLYLVNPNNPTGALIDSQDIAHICDQLSQTLIIVDEAYIDFSGGTSIKLVEQYPNLVITRTFSKAFALAGVRLGCIIAQESVIFTLSKLHNFKSVNSFALAAMRAAINDRGYTERTIKDINRAKEYLYTQLPKRNVIPLPSKANFILVEVSDPRAFSAQLARQNVYVRDLSFVPGIPSNTVRITIGSTEQMQELISRIDQIEHSQRLANVDNIASRLFNLASWIRRKIDPTVRKQLTILERREFNQVELASHTNNQLQELVSHSFINNRFYQSLWESKGIQKKQIDRMVINSFTKLPIVGKAQLRQATVSKDWFSAGNEIGGLISGETTGSSGEPFCIYFTPEEQAKKQIMSRRMYQWIGQNPGDPFLVFWRKKASGKNEKLMERFGLFKRLDILDVTNPSGSDLSNIKMAKIVAEIEHFRPRYIRGYVSALWLLAKYLLDNKIDYIRPQAIIASAESLPGAVEETIQQAFGCKVFNVYGATEAPLVAMTCPESSLMHVMSDFYHVELVDEKGSLVDQGEIGQIVITDLNIRSAPLIRYKIGDLARWSKEKCPCGRALPTLETVIGRTNDLFILPGGEQIISHLWHIYFRDISEIGQFQIIQEKEDLIAIKYTVNPRYEASYMSVVDRLQKKFSRLFFNVQFRWEKVDRINVGKGGKIQAVQSLVPNVFNQIN